MALLDLLEITASDTDFTSSYVAASVGGDTLKNFDGVFISAFNSDAATRTITITPVENPVKNPLAGEIALPNIVITVPAGGDELFSVPPAYQSAGGVVSMTYDDETLLTLATFVVRL